MAADSIQKTLKIFNFTTTNAILVKLTADIYPNKVFHLPKCWGVTHRVQEGMNKKTYQSEPKNQLFDLVLTISLYFNKKCSKFDASLCMSSLVKISNKINIIGSSGQKTTKEQPKMKKHLKT